MMMMMIHWRKVSDVCPHVSGSTPRRMSRYCFSPPKVLVRSFERSEVGLDHPLDGRCDCSTLTVAKTCIDDLPQHYFLAYLPSTHQ